MPSYQGMRPAWVDVTNSPSRPSRYALYPPLTPRMVAYLPVCSFGDGGSEFHETASFQDAIGDEVNTAAMEKAAFCMRTSPDAESMAFGVIKNLPSRRSEEQVLDVISQLGFGSSLTGFIMPTRVGKGNRKLNKGFAFVYFSDQRVCREFVEAAAGYSGFGEHGASRSISVVFSLHCSGSPRATSSGVSSHETGH